MTLLAPGSAVSQPTVPTRLGWREAVASTARTSSAAAQRASWRRSIATVPACPATPVNATRARVCPRLRRRRPPANPARFEDRDLLDVDLGVAEPVSELSPACQERGRVAAEVDDAGGEAVAIVVAPAEPGGIDAALDGATAEVGGVEADALFVGERGQLDGEGQAPPLRAEALDRGEGNEDAERTVVLAGVTNGIEVTAEDERRRAWIVAVVAGDQVAGGIGRTASPAPVIQVATSVWAWRSAGVP